MSSVERLKQHIVFENLLKKNNIFFYFNKTNAAVYSWHRRLRNYRYIIQPWSSIRLYTYYYYNIIYRSIIITYSCAHETMADARIAYLWKIRRTKSFEIVVGEDACAGRGPKTTVWPSAGVRIEDKSQRLRAQYCDWRVSWSTRRI